MTKSAAYEFIQKQYMEMFEQNQFLDAMDFHFAAMEAAMRQIMRLTKDDVFAEALIKSRLELVSAEVPFVNE